MIKVSEEEKFLKNEFPKLKLERRTTMACYEDSKILDFLTGKMNKKEEGEFKVHIAKCDNCAFRRYRKEDELLSIYHEEASSIGLI